MLHTFGSSYVARVSGNRKGCNLGVFFVVAAMELRPPYPLWRRQTLPFFLCCRLTGKETVCEKTVFFKWSILQVCVWCVGLHMLVCCGIHDNFFLNDPSCRCACGVWVCTCLCAVASMDQHMSVSVCIVPYSMSFYKILSAGHLLRLKLTGLSAPFLLAAVQRWMYVKLMT